MIFIVLILVDFPKHKYQKKNQKYRLYNLNLIRSADVENGKIKNASDLQV